MVMYGIGITTFREREEENINLNAYKMFKRGKKSTASKQITRQIKIFIKEFTPGKIIQADPAIGVYEGGSEPSSEIIIEGGPSIFNKSGKGYKALKYFKQLSHQDSILVYKIVKKGLPAIRLSNIEYKDIEDLRSMLSVWSDEKMGKFLTYNYEKKSVTIIHVPEWDEVNTKIFNDNITILKNVVLLEQHDKLSTTYLKKIKYHSFNVKNIII